MGTTVPAIRLTSHNPQRLSVEVRLAAKYGRKPETWHQYIYGEWSCFAVAEKVVAELVEMRECERAGILVAPIDAAMMSTGLEHCLEQAMLASAKADAGEDIAEAEYHVNPGPETAQALVSQSVRDIVQLEKRNAELRAKWGLK